MRNKSFKIAGFIVLAALLLVAYRAITANVEPFREIPSRIANFSAIETDGGRTTFDEHKGKATLVVLSASWCPACIAELNTLKNLHKEFSAKGLSILMVSEDDNVKIASRFKKKYAMPWTITTFFALIIPMLPRNLSCALGQTFSTIQYYTVLILLNSKQNYNH